MKIPALCCSLACCQIKQDGVKYPSPATYFDLSMQWVSAGLGQVPAWVQLSYNVKYSRTETKIPDLHNSSMVPNLLKTGNMSDSTGRGWGHQLCP